MRGHLDLTSLLGGGGQKYDGIMLCQVGAVSGTVPQRLGADVLMATALRQTPRLFIHIDRNT